MPHFFLHNSLSAGQVLLSRVIIQAMQRQFPEVQLTLECRQAHTNLWRDLGLPTQAYQGQPYSGLMAPAHCPPEAHFINLGFGVFTDLWALYGLTYAHQVHAYNRQIGQYQLQYRYLLPLPAYIPMLSLPSAVAQPVTVQPNGVFVENGPVPAEQNYFYLNEQLEQLAEAFPQFTLYCAAKPPITADNVVDCSGLSLLELSWLSDRCMALLTRGGDVNAATYTEVNRLKPRCVVGWDLPIPLWHELDTLRHHAATLDQVKAFLATLGTKTPHFQGTTEPITTSSSGIQLVSTTVPRVSSAKSPISSLMSILLVSHPQKQCGVHQYGLTLANTLAKSQHYAFHYLECAHPQHFLSAVETVKPAAIVYNYYPSTLPWVTRELLNSVKAIHIGIIHEITQQVADKADNSLFQYHIAPDPTLVLNNPIVFKTGRIIQPYEHTFRVPSILTIGSFGFGLEGKGFEHIVTRVQNEFDQAIIRLHIPFAAFGDAYGHHATEIAQYCQTLVTKPGIQIHLSHDFLTQEKLLNFLAQNTINAFFYDKQEGRGISSVIDYALAVKRPIAITRSTMFRHILSATPSICIENTSLKQIIANGLSPLLPFYQQWQESNLVQEYERLLDQLLGPSSITIAKPIFPSSKGIPYINGFNRILDNQARSLYKPVIDHLFGLLPEMMDRKIPEANIQQAFVMDTVQKFANQFEAPKILCVGSYEDTAAEGLKKLGYEIEEIDPMLNYDLDTFFQQSSTLKGSYDIVFSTSVLEHVPNDELFMSQIAALLAPNGVAILTCDYNDQYRPGDPLPQEDCRFYTQRDFRERILPLLKDCDWVDEPKWNCLHPDFTYAGCRYTFATLVFRKHPDAIVPIPIPLGQLNLFVVPDWSKAEETISTALKEVILRLSQHPDRSRMTVLIYRGSLSKDEINLILSGMMMEILMEAGSELDVDTSPSFSSVGDSDLAQPQWQGLIEQIQARIALDCDDIATISRLHADTLPVFEWI